MHPFAGVSRKRNASDFSRLAILGLANGCVFSIYREQHVVVAVLIGGVPLQFVMFQEAADLAVGFESKPTGSSRSLVMNEPAAPSNLLARYLNGFNLWRRFLR